MVCFLSILQKMASRITNEQFQGNVFDCHPLYQLLVNMPQSVVKNFTNKLGLLHNREFVVSPQIDWVKLGELGLTEKMATYLTKTFTVMGFLSLVTGGRMYLLLASLFFKNYVWSFSCRYHLRMLRWIHTLHEL